MPSNVELDDKLVCLLRGLLEKDPGNRLKMEEIKMCDWFLRRLEVEESSRVPVPRTKGGDPSKFSTVYGRLEILYDSVVHSPALSAQNLSEGEYAHRVDTKFLSKLRGETNRLDVTSSDEALTFAVKNDQEEKMPTKQLDRIDGHEKNSPLSVAGSRKTDHGKFCRFKQRACVVQ